ncbi:MAG: DUF434 domain-containing protein [Pirellulaceae bacterium]
MPDRRSQRGPHPSDPRLFAPDQLPALRAAVADFNWLLSRGYAEKSALELVGNRYHLTARQRTAVMRCACAQADGERRRAKQVAVAQLAGQVIELDGLNVLVTVEAALAGAVILHGGDGAYRDLCSVHGTYRRVQQTVAAMMHIGEILAEHRPTLCRWRLDRPVSNSGRLKTTLLETADRRGWNWEADLVADPDYELARSPHIVASSDRVVLDRCGRWFNLAREVVDRRAPGAWIVALTGGPITPPTTQPATASSSPPPAPPSSPEP